MGRPTYDPSAGHENVFARIVASDTELPMDWKERLTREGARFSISSNAGVNVASGSVNTTIASTAAITAPGKAVWIERVSARFGSNAIGQVHIGNDAAGRFPQWTEQFVQELTGPLGHLVRPHEVTNGSCRLTVAVCWTPMAPPPQRPATSTEP
jgi:hypothetical protein